MLNRRNQIHYVYISLESPQLTEGLAFIKSEWEKTFPNEPFAYKFLDESLAAQYAKEEKAMSVFTYFSILTIINLMPRSFRLVIPCYISTPT